MSAYDEIQKPWAAILQFADAKEDAQTLEGTLDNPLWKFLYSIHHSRHCGMASNRPAVTI